MSKQTSLVCEFLEGIKREAIKKYPQIIKNYVRGRQGIYALYKKNRIYYVGLASNLRNRLRSHNINSLHRGKWDRFSVYLTIGSSHLKELESIILRVINLPKGNKRKGKFKNANNLNRKFAADLRKLHRKEDKQLLGLTEKSKKNLNVFKKSTEGRQPVLSSYIRKSIKLRSDYKGRVIKASVRKNGIISIKGKKFNSPSLAARYIVKRRTPNGWKFWKYERAPGDWVKLDELRK